MLGWKWVRNAFAGLAGALICGAAAQAATITETVSFTAEGFGPGAPVDPLSGSFTFTIDPTQEYINAGGVTTNYLNIDVPSPVEFIYFPNLDLQIASFEINTQSFSDSAGYGFVVDFTQSSNAFFSGNGTSDNVVGNVGIADYRYMFGVTDFFSPNVTYTVTSAGVPEPATWVVMLAGLGGVGSLLRHLRRRAGLA
ncbi:PEPxxWA-CTERM sorting domain-containing protein [Phenylobacterium sp.]|uniref:PEPxxWA-CTERM sorting domain-containing protein n=1 Tax=Phenylobacterium sp. TaxID=1871053 RepID=UPI0025DE9AE1|nr:PEPxxWA-CTERM sorting domain-containing protein [Phenylobacterium sp.]